MVAGYLQFSTCEIVRFFLNVCQGMMQAAKIFNADVIQRVSEDKN